MTTWTSATTSTTAWAASDGTNEATSVKYNTSLAYNLDFITYNGYYVEAETDWAAGSSIETAWKDTV
jgi:hypothetical protein